MRYEQIGRGIGVASVYGFVILTLLVPNTIANKIAFALVILVTLMAIPTGSFKTKLPTFSPIIVLVAFSYGYLVSLFRDNDLELARQFLLSVAVLFLIYPVTWWRIEVDRMVVVAGVFLAAFTTAAGSVVLLAPDSAIGAASATYFAEYSMGSYGTRNFGAGEFFMLHAGAAPFLFLTYSVLLRNAIQDGAIWRVIVLLLVVVAILATTSRALAIAILVSTVYLVFRKMKVRHVAFVAPALVILMIVGVYTLLQKTDVLSVDEMSNSIKLGHASSFIVSRSGWTLFFGEGLGAKYFSSGVGAFLAHTEITPMDLARYFGVPLTAIVYAALLLPTLTIRSDKSAREAMFLMVVYHTIALTNPVLFNSYGLLAVVWYWARVLPVQPRDALGDGR